MAILNCCLVPDWSGNIARSLRLHCHFELGKSGSIIHRRRKVKNIGGGGQGLEFRGGGQGGGQIPSRHMTS